MIRLCATGIGSSHRAIRIGGSARFAGCGLSGRPAHGTRPGQRHHWIWSAASPDGAGPGGSPGPDGRVGRIQRTGQTPLYGLRNGSSLNPSRTTGSYLSISTSLSGRTPSNIPSPGNRPLRLDRQVPEQKFVIANSSGLITARIVNGMYTSSSLIRYPVYNGAPFKHFGNRGASQRTKGCCLAQIPPYAHPRTRDHHQAARSPGTAWTLN